MRLAAICVVLATCGLLIAMVIGQAVMDFRRQRARRIVDIDKTLQPYEVSKVIDLREQAGAIEHEHAVTL